VWPEILVYDSRLNKSINIKNLAIINFINKVTNNISLVVGAGEQTCKNEDSWHKNIQ